MKHRLTDFIARYIVTARSREEAHGDESPQVYRDRCSTGPGDGCDHQPGAPGGVCRAVNRIMLERMNDKNAERMLENVKMLSEAEPEPQPA